MKKNFILIILPIILLIMEILPYGAVLIFSTQGDKTIKQTYSYFDVIPFGNANFGPLLTAILTCVIIILIVLYLLLINNKIIKICLVILYIALATSLMPIIQGYDNISIIGIIISVLLLFELLLITYINESKSPKDKE